MEWRFPDHHLYIGSHSARPGHGEIRILPSTGHLTCGRLTVRRGRAGGREERL